MLSSHTSPLMSSFAQQEEECPSSFGDPLALPVVPEQAPEQDSHRNSHSDESPPLYRPRSTSRVGYNCRFAVVGAVLFIFGLVLLVHQERVALKTWRFYTRAQHQVQEYDGSSTSTPFAALVHLVSKVETTDTLNDPTFGVTHGKAGSYLQLQRVAEMYQWVESGDMDKQTGDYTYTQEWQASWQDSADFIEVHHPTNPPCCLPYSRQTFTASRITVLTDQPNALTLSPAAVDKMAQLRQSYDGDIDIQEISNATLRQKVKLYHDDTISGGGTNVVYWRTQESDENKDQPWQAPRIGDMRVYYRVVVPQTVSIVAALEEGQLVPFVDRRRSSRQKLLLVQSGEHTAAHMLQAAQLATRRNLGVWRFLAFILIYVGLLNLALPATVLQDLCPALVDVMGRNHWPTAGAHFLVVAAMITWSTMALCWLTFHPLRSMLFLALQAYVIYVIGQYYFEWWGSTSGGSGSHKLLLQVQKRFSFQRGESMKDDSDTPYQLVLEEHDDKEHTILEEETFMELGEVAGQ